MIKFIKICCFFVSLFTLNVNTLAKEIADRPQNLTLATTKWCPYTCFDESNKFGIIGIYIKKIMTPYGINLKISSYPWSRAIRLVESKKVDGLLTATHAEAPKLLFSESPIDSYQMCFYTVNSNKWIFDQPINFASNLLAVVQDYGYGEPLDSYIKNNSSSTFITTENVYV